MENANQPITLQDRAVVVTGGTTGIGRSTAVALVKQGANVLIFGRHGNELDDALEDIEALAGRAAYGVIADQSRWEDMQWVFDAADEKIGGCEILINNAAVQAGSILESDYPDWDYAVRTNLLGYMACCRLAIDRMSRKNRGHIVNVGSLSADEREPEGNVYVATKSAIRGFSEALRKGVNEKGIKVTLIEPGTVGTDMNTAAPSEQEEKEGEGKMLKAEDIAECICYTLTQPWRCDVIAVQIRPHLQLL